jgi:hypothetical protein
MALRRMAELEAKAAGGASPAPAAAPTATPAATPTKRSWSEVPGAALEAVPASAGRMLEGLYQMVRHPIDTGRNLDDMVKGAILSVTPDFGLTAAADKRQAEYVASLPPEKAAVYKGQPTLAEEHTRQTGAAKAVGGYLSRYGSEEGWKEAISTDPVGVLADLSTVLSGGAAIAPKLGATGAKVAPALATAAKYANPMTYVAPVITAPIKGAVKGVEAVYNMMNPKARALLEAAEGRGGEIVNALRDPAARVVSGPAPIAGELASGVGATKYAALQASAAKQLPTEYLAREDARNAARVAQVRTVGKNADALKGTKEARAAVAAKEYGDVGKQLVAADSELTKLAAKPSVAKAMARAEEMAAEKGSTFKPNGNYTVENLHDVKMAMDDLAQNPERFGIGAAEAKAITNSQRELVKWIETNAPGYKTARQNYARLSEPINQMEVGQYLESKLVPALSEEAKQKAGAYATALDNAPSTIKKATGGAARYDELTKILTPEQVKAVESVREDLARSARYDVMARKGASASEGAADIATQTLASGPGAKLPNLMSRVTSIANNIISRVEGKINRKLAIELATEMLNPETAALAMEKALAKEAKLKSVTAPIKKVTAATEGALKNRAVINAARANALAPEDKNKLNERR